MNFSTKKFIVPSVKDSWGMMNKITSSHHEDLFINSRIDHKGFPFGNSFGGENNGAVPTKDSVLLKKETQHPRFAPPIQGITGSYYTHPFLKEKNK